MSTADAPRPAPQRRTKIVATLGPASRDPSTIAALIDAGVNVFRLNLSHGSHDDHRAAYGHVRRAAGGRPVAVLADLPGPKIRVGKFRGGSIELVRGETVTVTTRDVHGEPGLIPSAYAPLARDVKPGDRLLLDDGHLELRVEAAGETDVRCAVFTGGTLKDRKGMNLPGVAVSAPALTDADRDHARFALDLGVDFLALSFVRRAADVEELRRLVNGAGRPTPIIAKVEKPEALAALDEILAAADGVMVARGDLGVEMPPEDVPIVQRDLVYRARRAGKPVIVATQMLESMTDNPRPTRAEVSDVSHAVFSGADAVMLSGETAAGRYPVPAVEMMTRVARSVEGWQASSGVMRKLTEEDAPVPGVPSLPLRLAVARATTQLSRDLHVKAVVVRSLNGVSAAVVSATRPTAPIVAVTSDPAVCRRLALLWGVLPWLVTPEEFDEPRPAARRVARELGLADAGQPILLLSGFGRAEPTLTVLTV